MQAELQIVPAPIESKSLIMITPLTLLMMNFSKSTKLRTKLRPPNFGSDFYSFYVIQLFQRRLSALLIFWSFCTVPIPYSPRIKQLYPSFVLQYQLPIVIPESIVLPCPQLNVMFSTFLKLDFISIIFQIIIIFVGIVCIIVINTVIPIKLKSFVRIVISSCLFYFSSIIHPALSQATLLSTIRNGLSEKPMPGDLVTFSKVVSVVQCTADGQISPEEKLLSIKNGARSSKYRYLE